MNEDSREQDRDRRSSARDPEHAEGTAGSGEFRQASRRLESAIDDLVSSASGAVNQGASRLVDELEEAARRLREQTESEGDRTGDEHRGHRAPGRRARHRRGRLDTSRASKHNGWLRDLYREPGRGWIAGVCAGLARYYQVEPWVARVVAFSLLIFIPQIAFWAYIIAIFMLARRPSEAELADVQARVHAGSSPAPELGPRLAPRPDVRAVRVRFRDLEHRLRRLEGHVTSREFTLAREFSELEREGRDRPV